MTEHVKLTCDAPMCEATLDLDQHRDANGDPITAPFESTWVSMWVASPLADEGEGVNLDACTAPHAHEALRWHLLTYDLEHDQGQGYA